MARGRKPKPTHLKLLDGSAKKDPQRLNPAEPAAPSGKPIKPRHIKGVAATEWKKISGILEAMGIQSPAYAPMLEQYCAAYQSWRECEERIEADGKVVTTKDGIKAHPLLASARSYKLEMHKWLTEMGLTPSSKTRIAGKGAESNQGSKWAQFLSKGKTG